MTKQKPNKKCFFQQKYFWSEPKTFESFSGVSFVKKNTKEASGDRKKPN